MFIQPPFGLSIQELIAAALREDRGDGDHTSLATIEAGLVGRAEVKMKENGVISGIEFAREICRQVDPSVTMAVFKNEGDAVNSGDIILELKGQFLSLLLAERLLLNCMQRMSGIATLTSKFVQAVHDTGARILDTRKTTPNFRMFEKWAVQSGGGMNHRFGLYDMILIKDNHVDAAKGIESAILKANDYLKRTGKALKIEIEIRNMNELNQALQAGQIHRIMLIISILWT